MNLPIDHTKSRQRRWQLRQADKGLCMLCAKRRSRRSAFYCLEHLMHVRVKARVYMRRYLRRKKAMAS